MSRQGIGRCMALLLVAFLLVSFAAVEEKTPPSQGTAALLLPHESLSASQQCKKGVRFEDIYECYIIIDVEVSDYMVDAFEQIECEDFMSIVARAKKCHMAFTPVYETNLYDDEGVRYKLYFSSSCRYFRIDSNYFRLTNRQARQMKRLLAV